MKIIDLIMILSFGAPLFISLISMGTIIAYRQTDYNTTKRKLLSLTIGYFLCVFISSITTIFFIFKWDYYIYSSPLSFLSLTLSVVFFYNIMYILTSPDTSKSPSVFHYIIPVILAVIHAVCSIFTPYSVQYDIVAHKVLDLDNYKWVCIIYASKLWVYAAYQGIYSLLILKRMPAYQLHINNYSADEEKSSLHWIYMVIILTLIIIPISFITFFLKKEATIIDEIIAIIANILYIVQLVTLQYNMFVENYIIMSKDSEELTNNDYDRIKINKKKFEQYINDKKPYLNQQLKITDMLYEFHTCRSYMSAFINQTYGMNFCCYINTLRMREFERLKKDPANSKMTDSELIIRAGFSYRNFIRFKKNKLKGGK